MNSANFYLINTPHSKYCFSMTYRFICYGKNSQNLDITLVQKVIGSKSPSFCEQIKDGDRLFLYLNSKVTVLAEVIGGGYHSTKPVWPDKLYPYRFNIRILKISAKPNNFLHTEFKNALYTKFGKGWGYMFLYSPREIPPDIGRAMEEELFKVSIKHEQYLQQGNFLYV